MISLQDFLKNSHTSFHAVANAEAMLKEQGFSKLPDAFKTLEAGGNYYAVHEGGALFAFRAGDPSLGFRIAESHTDSPALKLKGAKPVGGTVNRLNVEKYGGGLLYTYLDRPLRIAGRLIVRENGALKSKLFASDFSVVIPSLAVHLNPAVNNSLALNPQTDMLPLLSLGEDSDFLKTAGEVVDFDLFAVPAEAPFVSGLHGEFLSAPRLDNLTSVYASIRALIACEPKGIAACACFDNEEIGSGTRTGAASRIFPDLLERVFLALGGAPSDFRRALGESFALSIDNGHAAHPAHPEKADVVNEVRLNGGIVVKHHANYATDGLTSAIAKTVFADAGVPVQDFYSRSDAKCGSTLGNLTGAQLGIRVCDVGLAQLAMHSAVETMGAEDPARLETGLSAFFGTGRLSVE